MPRLLAGNVGESDLHIILDAPYSIIAMQAHDLPAGAIIPSRRFQLQYANLTVQIELACLCIKNEFHLEVAI
jgi:hypothetical protein